MSLLSSIAKTQISSYLSHGFRLLSIFWLSINPVEAEPALSFPSTKAEIVKALTPPPKTRGFSLKRGPNGIVNDLKVGALIHFQFDSAQILPASHALLHEYALAFKGELAEARFAIVGHADNIGDETYNLDLSKRRAQAVKNFLVQTSQIPDQQLIIRAYGERRPIASNETKSGRRLNRRVEFVRID